MPPSAVIVFAGPRDRYQSALALQENHALEALVTEAYFSKFWAETGLCGKNFHRFAKVRHHPDIPATKAIRSYGTFVRTLQARFDRRKDSPHFAIADRLLSEKAGQVALARRAPLIAYSYYADSAFRMMEGSGLHRVLFQVHPNGKHLRELFQKEIEKVPEAKASLMEETEMSPLFAYNDETFAMADAVICASSFTKHSLAAAGSKAPAHVVGYGVDLDLFSARTVAPTAKPLTVGFVGALSQRKGARYLLGALAALPKGAAKLIIYTRTSVDRDLIRGFEDVDVEIRGGLSDAALSADLSQICKVKVIVPCAAITLVGRGMRSLLHKLSDVWATFGRERVHMISQSSNDLNLTFVIDEADADGLLPILHAELIDSGAMPVEETEVFGPRWREIAGTVRPRGTPWWRGQRAHLLQLADAGTPRYVYHLPTVRARARALAAIKPIDQRYYAIKANSHPAILQLLEAEGFGLECVSHGELKHVFQHLPELSPKRVLFTPSFCPRSEYEAAFALGVTVTVDNVEALQRWPDLFRNRELWLRVDLGRGEGHHAKVRTGGKDSKFGLPIARVDEFVRAATDLGSRVVGLHAHLGSGVETAQHWRLMCDELAGFARRIGSVHTIDIGGGLPIPYSDEDEPFDLDAWAEGLAEVKALHPAFRLAIEPGRYLVAESGVLLTHVTQVVEKDGVRRVGLDAGMNALMRPALYDAWHDIENLSRQGGYAEAAFDVVGPICESSDVFGKRRKLPVSTAPDDVMLIADAGAYGYSMANTYNQRMLPREDVIE